MNDEKEPPREDWFSRSGWAVVLVAVLSMSAYSLFYVGRHLGMPWYFAAIVSVCFDGVAILAADYALRYARLGLTATGPQLTVFAFGGLSAYLNTLHAYFGHEIPMAKVLWAAPPVAAVLVFEFHNRWARLSALRAAGRVAEALPPLGRHSWIHHPVESLRTIRAISGERLTEVGAREAPGYAARRQRQGDAREVEPSAHPALTAAHEPEPGEHPVHTVPLTADNARTTAELVAVAMRDPEVKTGADIVRWMRARGREISEQHARRVRRELESEDAERRRSAMRAVPAQAAGAGD